jgi:hypothetical protein
MRKSGLTPEREALYIDDVMRDCWARKAEVAEEERGMSREEWFRHSQAREAEMRAQGCRFETPEERDARIERQKVLMDW